MLRKALVGVTPLVLGACSLLLGEGYTSPDSAGDASADATATADGPAGADATDAPEADGPVDGADADAGNVCNLQGSFCDDFERMQVKGAWDTVTLSGDAGLSIVPSSTASGALLQARVNELGDDALLEKAFTITPAKFHLAFTFESPAAPTVGGIYLAGIVMGDATPVSLVYLCAEQTGVYFVEQITDGSGYQRDAVPMTAGAPHRVVVDDAFQGQVTVTVDGVAVLDRAASSFLRVAPPKLTLGAGSIDSGGKGFTGRYDDLVFHLE